jgi:hypothetical protein
MRCRSEHHEERTMTKVQRIPLPLVHLDPEGGVSTLPANWALQAVAFWCAHRRAVSKVPRHARIYDALRAQNSSERLSRQAASRT